MVAALAGISILLSLIIVHELGHFLAAKAAGVRVPEFGLGYPPRLFAVKWGGTEYSVNLLFLGGFVKIAGMEEEEPGGLLSKGFWPRLAVLGSGSALHLLLPIVLFSISFMIPKETIVGQVQVAQVATDSPAERAGIHPSDIILKINDRRIHNTRDLAYNIQLNLGSETTMLLQSGRFTQRVVKVVPRRNPPPGQGATGIVISMVNAYPATEAFPFWEAIPLGVRQSLDTLTLAKNEVMGWFIKRTTPQVAGPIGIAQMTGEVAKGGFSFLLDWIALLNINFGIVNLLPIPMLDGSRILFLIIEKIRGGKRISPQREGLVHMIGFVIIIALSILVGYYDILRIIRGESLFP